MNKHHRDKAWYQSKWSVYIFILVMVLLTLRMAAPYLVLKFVNHKLLQTEGISGEIGDVDLHLYRGAYEIENVALYQANLDGQSEPFLMIKKMDISILWSALFSGHIVSEIDFYHPEVYVIDEDKKEDIVNDEIKEEMTWVNLSRSLVLFSIDKVQIIDGVVRLQNISSELNRETKFTQVNGLLTNITNSNDKFGSSVATFKLNAKLMDEADITVSGSTDPLTKKPTFDLNVTIERFAVAHIDTLIKFYTPIDLEAGQFDGTLEMVVKEGEVDGYVKAGIYNMTVFSWREDVIKDGDNPFSLLFEGFAAAISELLENDEKQLVATRLPLTGTIDNTQTSTFEGVVNLLKNAFIEASDLKIENSISFEQTEANPE